MTDFGSRAAWNFMFAVLIGGPALAAFVIGVLIGWWLT